MKVMLGRDMKYPPIVGADAKQPFLLVDGIADPMTLKCVASDAASVGSPAIFLKLARSADIAPRLPGSSPTVDHIRQSKILRIVGKPMGLARRSWVSKNT